MLHCFLAGIPTFICGRPGTSKSVAIQVVENILKLKEDEKKESAFFRGLPKANFRPIWGSEDTTATQVHQIFRQVTEIADKDSKILQVIYFEEMGVADCNKNNPLKVLHPLLEPRGKDVVSNVCFVGLSNSLLDAAKMNRMLSVPRSDMEEDELMHTINTYKFDEKLKEISKNSKQLANLQMSVSLALVRGYVSFRRAEKMCPEHPNFHGPRDFYYMCKWINKHLKQLKDSHAKQYKNKLFSLLSLAIERNFSGREFRIRNSQGMTDINRNISYHFKLEIMQMLTKYNQYEIEKDKTDECRNLRGVLSRTNSPASMISMNLNRSFCRHLMVFVEGEFYTDLVVEAIRQCRLSGDNSRTIVYLNNDRRSLLQLINDFCSYISRGYTVIMRNMDMLYPCLYDLFNLRYTDDEYEKDKKHCKIVHGTTEHDAIVHRDFKCVLLMDKPELPSSKTGVDLETKWPTALLNRFEKHLLTLQDLVSPQAYINIETAKIAFSSSDVVANHYIHNWSDSILHSLLAKDQNVVKLKLPQAGLDGVCQELYDENPLDNNSSFTESESESTYLVDCQLFSAKYYQSLDPYRERRVSKPAFNNELPTSSPEEVSAIQSSIRPLYNINYIYYLHKKYPGSDNCRERDRLYLQFKAAQCCTQSMPGMIDQFLGQDDGKNDKSTNCYVVFTLSQPQDYNLQDEVCRRFEGVKVVEHCTYGSVSVKRENIVNLLKDDEIKVVIFQFKSSEQWAELEEYKGYIEETRKADPTISSKKMIILLAHNSSYDQDEAAKFKFGSVHFHSGFTPLSMDVLGKDKSVYDNCYNNMNKTLLDVLSESGARDIAIRLALEKEFLFGNQTVQNQDVIKQFEDMISSENLVNDLFLPLMRANSAYLKDFTRDSRFHLCLDKSILEMIQVPDKGSLGNISEIVTIFTSSVIEYALQIVIRAVHVHCDLYFALRCFREICVDGGKEQSENQRAKDSRVRLDLWKQVASEAVLSQELIVEFSKNKCIGSEQESIERPDVFYRRVLNFPLSSNNRLSLPDHIREQTYSKLSEAIILINKDFASIGRGGLFYQQLSERIIPILSNKVEVKAKYFKGMTNHAGIKCILEDLLTTFSALGDLKGVTYSHLTSYCEPMMNHWKIIDPNPSIQSIFHMYLAVVECLPQELCYFCELESLTEGSRGQLMLCQEIEESLVESSNHESLVARVYETLGKQDSESEGIFYTVLDEKRGTGVAVREAKLAVLSCSLDLNFENVFESLIGRAIDKKRYEEVLRDLNCLYRVVIYEKISLENTPLIGFTKKVCSLIVQLLGRLDLDKSKQLNSAKQNESLFMLIYRPMRVLAQIIASNTSLGTDFANDRLVVLESCLSYFDETSKNSIVDHLNSLHQGKLYFIKTFSVNCAICYSMNSDKISRRFQ